GWLPLTCPSASGSLRVRGPVWAMGYPTNAASPGPARPVPVGAPAMLEPEQVAAARTPVQSGAH
uniref:hypothetical protein n=1 Tax=Nocardia abscessus TaxID=120957 RepID=UPI002453B335